MKHLEDKGVDDTERHYRETIQNQPSLFRYNIPRPVIVPYVKGVSEKYRRIGNHFNIRTIVKAKQAVHGTPMKTGPVRDAQQTKQCMYSIPCDCSRCYIGETSRPLEVRVKEHKYNLTQRLLEKSKLDRTCLRRRQSEPNTASRKYKEFTHVCLRDQLIIQPNLDMSPIWTFVTEAEV
jgi:predicted GIY-YIG superfamily endonuclease